MAPQEPLEGARVTGKADSSSKDSSPAPSVVGQGGKCPARSAPASLVSCPPSLCRHLKRRLGCSIRRLQSRWVMVSSRKSLTHKLSGIKGRLASLKKVPTCGTGSICSGCHRQHHSCSLHKQGGRYEVRLILCPSMASSLLVQPERYCPQGETHPRPSECDFADKLSCQGQIIQTEWSLQQEVFDLLCQTWHRSEVDRLVTRYNCKMTKLVSPVPDPKAWAVDALESLMGGPEHICLSSSVTSRQSDHQVVRSPVPESNPNSPRLSLHAMVLGSSGSVVSDTHLSAKPTRSVTQPISGARHRDLTSLNLHAWLLEPRQSRSKGSLAQWRYELKLLKDTQPEQSMRQSGPFLLDGVRQVRWTSGRHLSNK